MTASTAQQGHPTDDERIDALIAAERAALERLRAAEPGPYLAQARLRWEMATTTSDRGGRERPTRTYMDVVATGPERLAYRMLGGLHGDEEHHLLQDVTGELEELVRDRLTGYAARVLADREGRMTHPEPVR